MTAKVKHVDELIRDLRGMKTDARTMALIAVAGGLVVEGHAKINCLVDTGFLRNSIHTEVLEASDSSAIVGVGTNVEYAPPVEFGTKKWSGKSFLRAAFDEHGADAVKQMQATMIKFLKARLGK